MSIYDEHWGDVPDAPRPLRPTEPQTSVVRASRYVPATVEPPATLTPTEQGVLSQAMTSVGHLLAHGQASHLARSDDTALTHALGSLVYSIPYLLIIAAVTGAAMLLAFFLFAGDTLVYFLFWLMLWGVCSLHYLTRNREVGLRHSAAGIALEEIASREELAKYVVDKHIELIEKRWQRQG
jgi:hypothetical protein